MAVGPAPQDHQVVYTTLHFDTPWAMDSYLQVDGYKAWRKILAEKPDPVSLIEEIKKSSLREIGRASCRERACAGVAARASRPA